MPDMVRFGSWMKAKRKDLRYTRELFAEATGFSVPYLAAIEDAQANPKNNKLRVPSFEFLGAVSKVLRVTLAELFSEGMGLDLGLSQGAAGEPMAESVSRLMRQENEARARGITEGADTPLPVLGYLNSRGEVRLVESVGRRVAKGQGVTFEVDEAASCELEFVAHWASKGGRFFVRATAPCSLRNIQEGAALLFEPLGGLPEAFRTCLWAVPDGRVLLRNWHADDQGIYLLPVFSDDGIVRPGRPLAWLAGIVQ